MAILHGAKTIAQIKHGTAYENIVMHDTTQVFNSYAVFLMPNGPCIGDYWWSTSQDGSDGRHEGDFAPNGTTVYMFIQLSDCITLGGSGWTYISGTPWCEGAIYRVASGTVNGAALTLENTAAVVDSNVIRFIYKNETSLDISANSYAEWTSSPTDKTGLYKIKPDNTSTASYRSWEYNEISQDLADWSSQIKLTNSSSYKYDPDFYASAITLSIVWRCENGAPEPAANEIEIHGRITSLSNLYETGSGASVVVISTRGGSGDDTQTT